MSRTTVKSFKKAMHAGSRLMASDADLHAARDAALQLLRHSVKLGHPRLAVIRLLHAVQLHAVIEDALWDDLERLRGVSTSTEHRQALRTLRASRRAVSPQTIPGEEVFASKAESQCSVWKG